jgi:hypothetical protein
MHNLGLIDLACTPPMKPTIRTRNKEIEKLEI